MDKTQSSFHLKKHNKITQASIIFTYIEESARDILSDSVRASLLKLCNSESCLDTGL